MGQTMGKDGNTLGSSTFTTEFGHEIEAERGRWLRRRFVWYAGAVLAWNGFKLLGVLVRWSLPGEIDPKGILSNTEVWFSFLSILFTIGLYLGAMWHVRRHPASKIPPLKIVYWLIVVTGVVHLLGGPIIARQMVDNGVVRVSQSGIGLEISENAPSKTPPTNAEASSEDDPEQPLRPPTATQRAAATMFAGMTGPLGLLGLHFFACLFLPWTPGESLKPLMPLLVLNAAIVLVFMAHATFTGAGSVRLGMFGVLVIAVSGLVALPGAGICWWRNSRFRDRLSGRMIRGRYMELRQELTNARTIHESLFPRPCLTGPVRFNYVYEPMRQIGGDYLYSSFHTGDQGQRVLSVVLIDVTGHGIPAALTVNRLHGELERVFAENPQVNPGEVLRLLNSYVHLTLATHSVYVTAVCFRVDPFKGTLEYASGGHPPAFIRSVDARIEQLDSTTFVLGACAGVDFRHGEKSHAFHAGDTLIAYTDGALEARNANGRFLGIAGLLKILATTRPNAAAGWPGAILKAVEQHRHGPTEDDTLVIEITRPLGTSGGGGVGSGGGLDRKIGVAATSSTSA